MKYLSGRENGLPAKRIANPFSLYEVYRTLEDRLQLILHCHEIEKAPWRTFFKRYEYVDVTIGSKVFAQYGSE